MNTILVINTNDDQLTALKALLEKNNYLVVTTSKVCSAFKLIRKFHPDVVLIDTFLGYYDTNEICLEIKNNYRGESPKLVLHVNTGDVVSPFYCDGIIPKPSNSKNLLDELKRQIA